MSRSTGSKNKATTGSDRTCEQCGKVRHYQLNQIKRGDGRYCSQKCHYDSTRGKRTKEHGAIWIRSDGYIEVYIGFGKSELQHRLVMAETLGRALLPREIVHHLNHDRADNRPENLAIMANHSVHGQHHGGRPSERVMLVCQACGNGYEKKQGRVAESKFCSNACRIPAMRAAKQVQRE